MRLIAMWIFLVSPAVATLAVAADIPTRVGRLAFTEGAVAVYQDPDAGWEKGFVNTPLTSRNSVWTDPRSRADVRVGGIAIRLEETTQLDLAELDDDDLDGYLARGSAAVRVRHFNNNHRLDFSTPHAKFRFYGAGRYRLDVDPENEETVLTVFAGSASMRSASGDVRIQAGAAIRVFGTDRPSFVRETARPSRLDRWAQVRDQRWIETRTTRYVSTEMTGYEELDHYGQWIEEPGYGPLWYPTRVQANWVPYRHGRWAHVRPWGWTWIDDQPWGYAPFHYGRWVQVRDRWCWYPGSRVERPTWAPALVAFVGGANFSVAVRSGGGSTPAVGWYPLAPTERYEPWYQANPAYVSRVNNIVINNITVNNINVQQANEQNRYRAVTVVPRDHLIERRDVAAAMVQMSPELVRRVQLAPAQAFLPNANEIARIHQVRRESAPASIVQAEPRNAPIVGGAPSVLSGGQNPLARSAPLSSPTAPAPAPIFTRQQVAPAPTAAPPGSTNPLARRDRSDMGISREAAEQNRGQQQGQAQERAAREAQQQQQQQRAAQEQQQRAAQEQQQRQQQSGREQERAAREAQQQQQQRAVQEQQQRQQQEQQQRQQQGAREQERAAREAQQQQRQQQEQLGAREQERKAREAQQNQERAAREAQQNQERAAREAQQQQQQRAAQEQAQRQQQERAAQEQAQRQQQERAAREAAQQQERAAREAGQQQQRSAREQERAAREAAQQQRPAPAAQPPAAQPQPQAAPAAPVTAPLPRERGRGDKDKDKDKEKDKDDKDKDENERGRGKGRDR